MELALQFVAFFAFILLVGYLLPAAQFYYLHGRHADRIQPARPRPGQIARELRLSLLTIAIFAIGSTGLMQMYQAGWTNIYWDRREYFPGYGVLSVVLCLVLHDTWFYWSHRAMHTPALFKLTHAGHHKSVTPTPWAMFAFQPAEAVIQFAGIALLVIFLPLHPLALLAFLGIDTVVNVAGHCGYECVPGWVMRWRPFRIFSTVTSHDAHHTNMRVNFGSFFNAWDRICGTYNSGLSQKESHSLRELSAIPQPHSTEKLRSTEKLSTSHL